MNKIRLNGGSRETRPTLLFKYEFVNRYTLRLHRRLREIAGFREATLPGLEHTLAVQWLLGQPRVASASR